MKYCVLVLTLVCTPVWAINKCTGSDGRVTYQEAACPTDAKGAQPIKTWENSSHSSRKAVEPNLQLVGPPAAAPLLDLYRRWADAERLAMATSRVSLATPAASMQALQREAEQLQTPECLAASRKALVELITKSSNAVLQFPGKEEVTGMACLS